MAAGASRATKQARRVRFFNRLATIARKHGYTYTRERGQAPLIVAGNYTMRFDMVFSNASNGETFCKTTLDLSHKGLMYHYHNWTWCDPGVNSLSRDLWRCLQDKRDLPMGVVADLFSATERWLRPVQNQGSIAA